MRNFCLVCFIVMTQSGCSLILGNVRPVEEKSNVYGVLDLSKTKKNWTKLDSGLSSGKSYSENSDTPDSGISDIAFQSNETASIISINSACKSSKNLDRNKSLKELSRELLLGISDITLQEEKNVQLDDTQALQTTLRGRLNNEDIMLQTVVLKRDLCVYDLMYVSRPNKFEENRKDFADFVSSLRLR